MSSPQGINPRDSRVAKVRNLWRLSGPALPQVCSAAGTYCRTSVLPKDVDVRANGNWKRGKKACSIKPRIMADYELPFLVFPRTIPGRLSSTREGILLRRAGPFPSPVSMKEHRQIKRSEGGVKRKRWEGRSEEVQVEVLADIPDYSHQECQSVRSHRRGQPFSCTCVHNTKSDHKNCTRSGQRRTYLRGPRNSNRQIGPIGI